MFDSKIDVRLPVDDKDDVDLDNISIYHKKWFDFLEEEISEFAKLYPDLHKAEITKEMILDLNEIFDDWITYIMNILASTPNKYVFTMPTGLGYELQRYYRQINEIIILHLSDFKSPIKGSYACNYIETVSNKISDEINSFIEILLKFQRIWRLISNESERIYEITKELSESSRKVAFLYCSLYEMKSSDKKTSRLGTLLLDFNLPQASSRLETAESFLNDGVWDKAVGDIRIVLEITVTEIVRRILGDKYWNQPFKDGIEILRQKGIIRDEITGNHFKVKDIGVYGLVSLKSHHPDGVDDSNLANSELEAKYYMSLAENVIIYLLSSFQESEFFDKQ